MDSLSQIWELLRQTKVELQPLYALISMAVIGFMQLVKNPTRMKWLTVYSRRGRAWMVMVASTVATFALGILLGIRAWVELVTVSALMGFLTVGAYEWLKAAGDQTQDTQEKAKKDPRRP